MAGKVAIQVKLIRISPLLRVLVQNTSGCCLAIASGLTVLEYCVPAAKETEEVFN